jgi:hypothetical protein
VSKSDFIAEKLNLVAQLPNSRVPELRAVQLIMNGYQLHLPL